MLFKHIYLHGNDCVKILNDLNDFSGIKINDSVQSVFLIYRQTV